MFFNLKLWALTEGVRARIAWAVVVGLLAALVGIVRLGLLGWLLARVYAGDPLASLAWPIAAVAAVMVLRGFLEHWRTMVAHETAARVQVRLRAKLYDQVVRLGPAHFGFKRTGDVLLSLVEGVEQLEVWFGQYLPQLFVAVLTPILLFALMAPLDLPVAAVLLGFALVTFIAPAAFHSWDARRARERQSAYADFASEFLDAIQGLATLKAFGQSAERGRLLAGKAHEVFRRTMWVLATNSLTRGITDTGLAVGAAVALGLGAYRVQDGTMSIEVLLIVLMMGIEVFRPQRELRSLLHDGMNGLAAAEGVFSVLDATPVVSADPAARMPVERLAPTVEFDAVDFAYPGSRRGAHRQLSFTAAAGERLGFVGSSGAGKSTVVKLLLRLYDPDGGSVRLGGADLRTLPARAVHEQIAVVNQDCYLFHGTVEDNLRFGNPDASQEQIEAAARAANAHGFITALPQGYRTVVGERGIRLSGGQRQRIAIARAILRDSPILVLDEALSAVDAENEAVIQEALDRLMVGRTTLIFAHRLSSVIGADRILVLDEGQVVEEGDHRTLMAAGGTYHRLMSGQADEAATAADYEFDRRRDEDQALVEQAVNEHATSTSPSDDILRAEGLGWSGAFRELFRHIVPWRGKLVATFGLGVFRVLALIGVGVLSALIVAAVKQDQPFGSLLVALLVLAPLAGIGHWLESWLAHDMAFRLLSEMRIALFRKLDELAPAYLVGRRTGDLVGMATHDVEMVEYFFAHTVAPAFVAVLIPVGVLGTLAVFGWEMALALIPFLALVAISPFLARHRVDHLGSRAREALGDLNAHAVDTVQGLTDVIAFEQIGRRRAEFVDRAEHHVRQRLPFYRDLTFQTALLEVATGLGALSVVVTGAWLVTSGRIEPTLLPLLTLLALSAFLPVSEIAHIGRRLADTLGATRRLHAVHNEPVPVVDGPVIEPGPPREDAMGLDRVRFSYFGNERLALEDVSLQVPRGKTVALVGPSGAGKTTVAHLLLRFWDPQHGAVSLNGRDLRDYELEAVRSRIALVTQDTYLFNETLRANILMARPGASEAELAEAVERASLGDFVSALPEGLDTRVGERGARLSGGQRQRVAIARAFLKDAPILVLDEATSHLDAVNEQAVRHALDELMSERTTVVIAHRLSTVRHADRIVVLEAGRVIEVGDHDSLLARGGLYSQLVGRQLAGAAAAE